MNEYQNVPEEYQADTDNFNELYIAAWLLIIRALGKLTRLPQNPSASFMLQVERQVNQEVAVIISNLEHNAVSMASDQITQAYTAGVDYSRVALSQENKSVESKNDTNIKVNTGTNNSTNNSIKLNDGHSRRLEKMINQTQADLLLATGNTHNNIKQLVRKVVSREISGAGRSGMIGKKSNMALRIEDQLRKQFLENGIKDADTAIIDRANRRWKLRTYSEMVARTKINMAYIDAVREESLQNGSDLAIISTKPDTHDACLNYEGMIISLNGITAGYLTYDQIRATKLCFHPNCGHFVRPVAGVDWIPKKLMAVHEKQMNKYNDGKSTLKQQSSQDLAALS